MFFNVIIPTSGRLELLNRALHSLNNQIFKSFIVTLVDDRPADDLIELNEGFPNLNIVVIKNKGNRGVSCARNAGIEKSSSQWIVFLDDDDELMTNYLSVLYNEIILAPQVGVFWCGVLIKYAGKNNGKRQKECCYYEDDQLVFVGASYGLAVNRNCFEKYGKFNESYIVGEDTELFLRFSNKNVVSRPIKSIGVVKHETHNNRLSAGFQSYSANKIYEKLFTLYAGYFENNRKNYCYMLLWSAYVHIKNKNYKSACLGFKKMLSIKKMIWTVVCIYKLIGHELNSKFCKR